MGKTKKITKIIETQKQETDLKGTIVGFIAPDAEEKTQEEEIQEFKLKKQTEKELAKLSEEEQKQRRRQYEEDEEKIERVKAELLQSIKVRIPAIEKKFKIVETNTKNRKGIEKIKQKEIVIEPAKNENSEPNKENGEKERE